MMGGPASREFIAFRSETDHSEEEESGVRKYIQVPGEGKGQNRLAALLGTWRGPGACTAEIVGYLQHALYGWARTGKQSRRLNVTMFIGLS